LFVDGNADPARAMRCGRCWSLLCWTVRHHDRAWLRVPYGSLSNEPTLKPSAHMYLGTTHTPNPDRRRTALASRPSGGAVLSRCGEGGTPRV